MTSVPSAVGELPKHLRPRGASGAQIEGVAAQVRRLIPFRGEEDPGDFLPPLVARLGGKISVVSLASPKEFSGGSLVVLGTGNFAIKLSPLTSPLRDNFTIAHELGHYILHYPHDDPPGEAVEYHRFGSGSLEREANRFAAALLMPQELFLEARKRFDDNVYRIAGHFGVSPNAADVRMKYIVR